MYNIELFIKLLLTGAQINTINKTQALKSSNFHVITLTTRNNLFVSVI